MIPVHNEAGNIGRVVDTTVAVLSMLTETWQVILLVDDGSTDGTAETARTAMGDRAEGLRVIRHPSKRGYGVTVADGLTAAAPTSSPSWTATASSIRETLAGSPS